MLGDLNIAEPGALIGFAGPRVIEQTIRQKLPPGFQRSEFLLEHGMLDAVVHRKELKPYIARALEFMTPGVSHSRQRKPSLVVRPWSIACPRSVRTLSTQALNAWPTAKSNFRLPS